MATKIGVYFDQSAIGGGLDVEALAAGVEKRWSELAPVVKVFPVLADEAARKEIVADIEENELDGVAICGTSARVDWDLYCFDGVQVERVSLREGCVLAYKNPDGSKVEPGEDAPELLTMMATDYVNMGIIKLQKSNVPEPEALESTRRVLVLGGGWAGMQAALAASGAGTPVTLVEKEAQLGGRARNFLKTIPLKAPHQEAHPLELDALIAKVEGDPNITVCTSSTLARLAGCPGQYTATIAGPSGEQSVEVGAAVLATGWQPLDNSYLAPLGYGASPKVMTAAEFELKAKNGEIKAKRVAFILDTKLCVPCDTGLPTEPDEPVEPPEKTTDVAASQPDGEGEEAPFVYEDMESVRHLPYSNAVSSVVALKQAGYVADLADDAVAYIVYDSMVVQGVHERYYKAAQDNPQVMLTKGDVREVVEEGGSMLVRADNTLLGGSIELAVDLVVLPTGIVPTTAKEPIMQFEYRQGPAFPDLTLFDGYADSNYICFPYETRRTGVYAAGCVRQPMTLDAALEDANGAALKAIQCIESVNRGVAVHPRSGDLSYPVFNFTRCTQCKRCTEECPFGALDDDEKGTPKPNPTRCRRCGTCLGACPERVISFDNYNIDQIGSMIRDIKVPDDMDVGGPRVVILACENDALPAFDMAAMRGQPWSPYVRIIPVRCLGSVNAIWIADAMSKGIDGVMMVGCKYGDDYQCHFVKGSEICSKRRDNIAETLDRLGVEPDRVAQYQVAIDDYNAVPAMVDEFMKMIFEKGPNPFKGY